ncbi:hypothetical protein Tco_0153898 [Tanacetum coccineum]
MHNNKMAAGSEDFPTKCLQHDDMHNGDHCTLRYLIQEPNGDALLKCILKVHTLQRLYNTSCSATEILQHS